MTESDLDARIAWQQHVGGSTAAARWYDSVMSRYRESHRHYHDGRHVRWVVRHVVALADGRPIGDLGAIVAAAFFHDAVYDPTATDNEVVSAQLATGALTELGWSHDRVRCVASMIEGTAGHDHTAVPSDDALLFAADLAVLAADPSGYGDYVRNVRREYRHITEPDWAIGRGAVVRGLLDRPAIYAPHLALDDWEQRARANLEAELAALER